MECSICYEEIDKNEFYQKWSCKHNFHKKCVQEWNHGCPNCRCMNVIQKDHFTRKNLPNVLNISYMKRINPLVGSAKNIYLDKWNDRECITYNHNIICSHLFGVVMICEPCNKIQCFNKMH